MKKKEWLIPAVLILALVIVVSGTLVIVDWTKDSHKIVPADNVIINGVEYDVLDLLTDSGMEQTSSELGRFYSLEEINDIVGQEGNDDYYYFGGLGGVNLAVDDAESSAMTAGAAPSDGDSYSTTNVQVEGVDEGDIVKNDGRYAYIASGDRKSVFIIDAYPPGNAGIVSEIKTNGIVVDMYLKDDLLAIIQQTYYFEGGYQDSAYMYSDKPMVFIKVYDIGDRENPVVHNDASLVGEYSTSRMIDQNLYILATHSNYGEYENVSQLPLPIDCLYYIEDENAYYSLTNFLTMDIEDADANPGVMGIYMNYANTVYVSQKNIYITHMKAWSGDWDNYDEATVVHRIGIQGQGLKYRARGEVPGRVLNRYSMDEYDGHFRIATTKGWSWSSGEDESRNMVHVLDMALEETGELDNIAPGEQIYSARFMGPRCYLVTYKQIDPFFAIDLRDAENPKILGELKIPGYSTYLHPYDENHIIGIGKDDSLVKISLFNVTDVENPKELDTYIVDGDYSDSTALYDPHAFNFDSERGLLVIPVTQYNYDYIEYSRSYESSALVLSISLGNGINLETSVLHPESDSANSYYDYYYGGSMKRSFFIGDVLYTVSDTYMKANNIDSWGQEALVELA